MRPGLLILAFSLLISPIARPAETPMLKTTYSYKQVAGCSIGSDVHRPADQAIRPVVVWIHGGALIFGSKADIRTLQLRRYLEAGFTAVSIDYRLAPETKLPEILDDVRAAEGVVVPGDMITIEILDGVIEVEVISEDEFRVNMGRVVSFEDNPSDFVGRVTSRDFVDEGQLNPQVGNFRLFSIRQEPHLIVETDRNKFDIEKTYFEIKDCGYFPNSVNLNFIKIVDDNTVENLTCERGVDGVTQSCGTGSTSIAQYMFERFGCDRLQVVN